MFTLSLQYKESPDCGVQRIGDFKSGSSNSAT